MILGIISVLGIFCHKSETPFDTCLFSTIYDEITINIFEGISAELDEAWFFSPPRLVCLHLGFIDTYAISDTDLKKNLGYGWQHGYGSLCT